MEKVVNLGLIQMSCGEDVDRVMPWPMPATSVP
jgi:hypothetical protein